MTYDAIVVLGGGLREGAELPEYVRRRFDRAIEEQTGEPIVALSGGTMHRAAMVDEGGRPVFESRVGAQYLMSRGIPSRQIFCETTSYDTIGNAFFSRMQIVEPMGWRRLLVITSDFHILRTKTIFDWIYHLEPHAEYELTFAATTDSGLGRGAIVARRQRELTSLLTVMELRGKLKTVRDVAEWLFTEHEAYTPERAKVLAAGATDLLSSY